MDVVRHGKVETISNLAQWKIYSFGPMWNLRSWSLYRSDCFKMGNWEWSLSVEKNNNNNKKVSICLYLQSRISGDQYPIARFMLRVFDAKPGHGPYISSNIERRFVSCYDFVLPSDPTTYCPLIIDIEFMDLKIFPLDGGEVPGIVKSLEIKSSLLCLSNMLEEGIHADLTINTADGPVKAHMAVLSASSPVFKYMFSHYLKEKVTTTVDIGDMSLECCTALLAYMYGTIKKEEFWKQRLSLLRVADKYEMIDLKDCCEASLSDDISSNNVLERLEVAWLHKLDKIKKMCLSYLFDFRKIYDVREEINGFFLRADNELKLEIFQQMITVSQTL